MGNLRATVHSDAVCAAPPLGVVQKEALVKQVVHQCIVMQYILELAKTMKVPPRACVDPFFSK